MAELFFRVKVELIAHAKWQRLMALGPVRGGPAAALWLAMMARTSEEQQGGRVSPLWPAQELRGWSAEALRQASADLVAAELWDVTESVDGWEIHDFLEHQGSGAGVLGARRPAAVPANETKEERAKRLARERSRRAYQKRTGQAGDASVRGERENASAEREREREKREPDREKQAPDSHADTIDSHGEVSRRLTLSDGDSHASPSSLEIRERDSSDARERENVRERETERETERESLTIEDSNALTLTVGFAEVVRATIAKAYRDRDLKLPPECAMGTGHHPRVMAIAKALEDAASLDAALRGFFATPKVAANGYPLRFLENNPNEFLLAGRAMAGSAPQTIAGASSASRLGSVPHLPQWMPGGPQAVVACSFDELVAKLRTSMEQVIRADGTTNLALPIELREPERHAPTWRSLATWACSRTHRCRIGDRETAPDPEHPVSRVWRNAVRGWLADPLAIARGGEGGELTMELLVNEPERMWAEGRHMGGRP